MDVSAPQVFNQPLVVPNKTLMGPGPSNCSPRVLHAMGRPVIGHMHPEMFKIMDDIKEGLKYVFQTNNELTLALSTSGHGAMEAVLCNLIERGDNVLVACHGIWGERAAEMARRYGANVTTITKEPGQVFCFRLLENAIKANKPKLLFIVQGDSSTGVHQPLDGLGNICHRYNCLLAVDTVASLGGVPLFMDRWGIDAIYSGSQKVLGAPPGLAPISFSPRAKQVILNRKTPVMVFYWDMKVLGQQWECFGNIARPYHHTVSSNLLYGLREGLALIVEEGLPNVIKRHAECAQRLYKGLGRIGLDLFVEENKRLSTVTTICVPQNVDWKEVTAYAMKNYSIEISGGLGPSAGKVLRIGLMGYNATAEKVDVVLEVLEEALKYAKFNKSSKL